MFTCGFSLPIEARQLDVKVVDDTINAMPEHDWFTKGLGKEQVQQILDF